DLALDGQLGQLSGLSDNMISAVAWFGETTISAGQATSTVVFEGPYSATAADVVAPSAPSGVVAVSANGSVTLSWDANPEPDLSGYLVHRSEVSGGPYSLVNQLPQLQNVLVDSEAGAGDLHYVITAIDASDNESLPSVEVMIESTIDILVINGYFDAGNTGYQNSYMDVLDALGRGYQAWDPFVDGPVTTALLAEYTNGVVMWPIGYFHTGFPDQLGPVRQALLMEYLQAGGNLVLSGAYASAYLDNTALFTNYLFLQHEQWDMDLPGLLGEAGNPLGDGMDLQLSSGFYQSELTPLPPAQKAFSYDLASGSGILQGGGAAVVTVDETYKAAVLAFPFTSVMAADRSALMARILEWMLPSSPCADPFIRGDANGSGAIDIADAIFLLDYLFSVATAPSPVESGDSNADGSIDISDAIYLLIYMFSAGDPPPAPYPDAGCP
ncbi:MAG: dockerin type I domain-containing protein, partial [Planctomycetota bacterium]|nr:dockerin type I domain-containing protein [Planctomycetota bacterium]